MRLYIIVAAIAIPVVAVLFVGAGYLHDEVINDDRVSRGVTAEGIELARLPEPAATAAIAAYEQTLVAQPVELSIDGSTVLLDPALVGLAIDEDAVVEEAMTTRRADGLGNFGSWVGTFTSLESVAVPVTYDQEALEELLAEWSRTQVNKPAYEGAVLIENGTAVPEYPRAGLVIDVDAAVPLIAEQLVVPERTAVVVPLEALEPVVQPGEVDVAVVKANQLIGDAVTMRRSDNPRILVFTKAGLASALRSEVVVNSPATVEVSLDPEVLTAIALEQAENFVIPPTDATFSFSELSKTLSIVPSEPGQKVDLEQVPALVERAALSTG
ncbi:MAG: peptidoglycan binding domain-containing protein, partial [Acidimicrobiia bacterium]